jgi:hypothetical protein
VSRGDFDATSGKVGVLARACTIFETAVSACGESTPLFSDISKFARSARAICIAPAEGSFSAVVTAATTCSSAARAAGEAELRTALFSDCKSVWRAVSDPAI